MTAVPLKSLCQIRHGGTPSKANAAYWDGAIPWVSPKDMKSTLLDDASDHITVEAVENSATSLVPEKSILVVVRSGILAHSLPVAQATRPLAFNQDIKALMPDAELVDPDYLFWFVRSQEPRVLAQGVKKGATVHSVQSGFIENLRVPLPRRAEQRRIVDLLSRAEGIVRLRREAERKAAELIPALFLDMFGDPGTNPKGWESKKLGEFCKIIGGSSLPAGEPYIDQADGLLLMKVSDMNSAGNEVFIYSCKEWIPEQKRTYSSVSEGTIVFPKRGAAIATNKKRIVTRPLLLDPNLMGVLPEQAIVSTDYLFQWFSAFDLADISSGTTVPQLNKGDLTPLVVPIPPTSLQRKFAEKRAAVMSIQAQQANASAKAQATFDVLLAQAFSS